MEAANLADLYNSPLLDWSGIEARLWASLTQAPGTGGPDRHTCWLATINPEGGSRYCHRVSAADRGGQRLFTLAGEHEGRDREVLPVSADEAAARAQRDLVRRGYDVISRAYRTDDGVSHSSTGEDTGRYRHWVAELAGLLPPRARVVDLGCGAGVPGTLALTEQGLNVLGVDFSAVQLERAARLVPAARFVRADMAEFQLRPGSVDAVTAFYSLIHVPLADQQALLPRIRAWLCPGGHLLAVVGAGWWTGTEAYLGADMFWDHADTQAYLRWFRQARLAPVWHRFVPEGNSGHGLILAVAA